MAIKFVPKVQAKASGAVAPPDVHEPDPTPLSDHEQLLQIKDFPQNHLLYHLHKRTKKERAPRHHNVVHLSDLDPSREWCPREPALLTHLNKTRPYEYVATCTSTAWNMGHKGADLFIEMMPPEKVWGGWYCRACKEILSMRYTPSSCPTCGAAGGALRYKEVFMRDPETRVVASMDLFVDILGNGMKTGVEIKTEGNEAFKKRTKPEFEHEWRTMGYLWMMEVSGLAEKYGLNTQEARIVYITKEGHAPNPKIKEWGLGDWAHSSVKEYWVTRDDSMLENALERVKDYRKWRHAWDDGLILPLPARIPACKQGNARCKRCPVHKDCWNDASGD